MVESITRSENREKVIRVYPLVTIVIPTHNRREKVMRLIRSIFESNYPREKLEIIVIDDASTDGTHEIIKKMFPQVKIIRNEEEKLLSESRNIGIKASRGEYVFLIDDDNVIDKNTIRDLVNFMEYNPRVGVAAPIMYFLRDPKRVWCAGIKRSYWTTITKYIGFNTIDAGQFKKPHESDDFPNAFMVRREVFEKVGLFNSKLFPIHYDEGDFCQRVRRSGYKVILVPTAKVWHDIPLPNQSRAFILRLKNPLRAYYASRSRILFHWMWSRSAIQRIIALKASIIIMLYYFIIILLDPNIEKENKTKIILKHFEGIMDAFRIIKLKGGFYG